MEQVIITYGHHRIEYSMTEPFARDITLVQHTNYSILLCRPEGGAEMHVTSPDLTQYEGYFYSVTTIRSDASIQGYSGLLRETSDSARSYLPEVSLEPGSVVEE